MKEKIQKFKDERIGSRKRGFVETVTTEVVSTQGQRQGQDGMDLD